MLAERNERARTAALAAAEALPAPDAVTTVSYRSGGKTMVIGTQQDIQSWLARLPSQLELELVVREEPGAAGFRELSLTGWLGNFTASWPEPDGQTTSRQADLVLDLSHPPLIDAHQPPPGYFAPAGDDATVIASLADLIGEFDKPKYFAYKEKLCAHSRNRQTGCTACIDICSARAIESAGNGIAVNAHLCAGCGACTTVCPSGAIRYAYPGAAYTGERLRTLLNTYLAQGGEGAILLFHSESAGSAVLADVALPPHLIPIGLHHTASVGIEVWLAAIAYGARAIAVLMTDEEAPAYREAIGSQMLIAQTILSGLGYGGRHLHLLDARAPDGLDGQLASLECGDGPAAPATFHPATEKRNTLDLALHHLYRHAPTKPAQLPLPPGAPYGQVVLDTSRCSLCMACVGACPSMALLDSPATPRLSFVEKNCVQCGLCVNTCPEDALTLAPRMSFLDTWNMAVVLHETEPFCCIRCHKPFATMQAVELIISKLAIHPAFAGRPELMRMCGDCRVIEMMQNKNGAPMV